MFPRLLSAAALAALSAAAPSPRSSDGYAAIPLTWKYGGLPKITADVVWGTPGQNSSVETVFDTGSDGFWVAGPDNLAFYGTKYKGDRGPCNETLTPFYDWTASTTHTPAVDSSVWYSYAGNAHIVKTFYTMNDTLGFAQSAYPKLPNRRVAVSNETLLATGEDTTCGGYDTDHSILGMGPASNFRGDLLDDGLVSSNILSTWFDQAPKDLKGTYTGTAVIGALPPSSKYSGSLVTVGSDWSEGFYYATTPEFKTAPLNNTGAMTTIPMDYTPPTCLLDSGSPNLELPISTEIANITGLTVVPFTSILAYEGSCESIPASATLDFDFQNVTISLPYTNLVRGYLDGVEPGYCVLSAFLGESSCTLGAPFFSAAVVVLDDAKKEISLAQGGISTGAADGVGSLSGVQTSA